MASLRTICLLSIPLITIICIYNVYTNYHQVTQQQCETQLSALHNMYKEKIAIHLLDLSQQIEKENDYVKKYNKLKNDYFNFELLVERYEATQKEQAAKLLHTEEHLNALKKEYMEFKNSIQLQEKNQIEKEIEKSKEIEKMKEKKSKEPIVTEKKAAVNSEALQEPTDVQAAEEIVQQFQQRKEGSKQQIIAPTSTGVNILTRDSVPVGIPVVVLAYNRPVHLKKTLDSILSYQPPTGYPLFVSQDGNDESVTQVIIDYIPKIYHIRFEYQAQSDVEEKYKHYYKISQHYKYALSQLFDEFGYEKVIILEDDMLISPDFFTYFGATENLLDKDSTLMCVSAWNENGQSKFVIDPVQLYRTDSFPGIGWMLRRELWDEVSSKWPAAYWDEWMREADHRKDRSCIFPEVSRVYTFGDQTGQLYGQYLKDIKLNDRVVQLEQLSYLEKKNYDQYLSNLLLNGTVVDASMLKGHELDAVHSDEVIVYYNDLPHLDTMLDTVGLIKEHRAAIPRTSYNGLIPFRWNGKRVWLVPNVNKVQDRVATKEDK